LLLYLKFNREERLMTIRFISLFLIPVFIMAPFTNSFCAQMTDTRTFLEKTKIYVHSNNGLIVRTEPSKSAERMASLAFGQSAVVIATPEIDESIEAGGIKGFWVKIKFGPKSGYVFSGFISRFPVSTGEKPSFPDYHKKLKKFSIDSEYTNKDIEASEKSHAGNEKTITLKKASIVDAFLISRSLFHVPLTIKWPKKLISKHTFAEDSKKPDKLWASTLDLVSVGGVLKEINYRQRASGWGVTFTASATNDSTIKLTHYVFSD